MREAGTYLVIANPRSFASLPEYCNDGPPSSLLVTGLSDSGAQTHAAQNMLSIQFETQEVDDPNIIILKTFEEYLRRSPVSATANSGPAFAAPSRPSAALEAPVESVHISAHSSDSGPSKLDEARSGGRDAHLLQHYRSHISEHVIKVGSRKAEEDPFEIQARTFPPVSLPIYAAVDMTLNYT